MQVIHLSYPPAEASFQGIPASQVLAIGDFDGVHLGHQEVISKTIALAAKQGCTPALMTFDPHPRAFMGQAKYDESITPMDERLKLFAAMGIEFTYIVKFDQQLMTLAPHRFIDEVLIPLNIRAAVVGFDFTFGYKGQGKAETLAELSNNRFQVEIVEPFRMGEEKVSSSAVRSYLEEANPQAAQIYLGRPYTLTGVVVDGDKRGRTLGFPTANMRLDENYILPANGVYAVSVLAEGKQYGGVMNLGYKPTFDGNKRLSTEVHIFDFNGDLYGKSISVSLLHFLRSERKFPSLDELVSQIHRDAEMARDLLQSHNIKNA